MNDDDVLDGLIASAKRHDHPPASATERAWASLAAAFVAGEGPSVPVEVGAPLATGLSGLKSVVIVGVTIVTAATTAIVASAIGSRDHERAASATIEREGEQARPAPAAPPPATLPAVVPSPPALPPPRPADAATPTAPRSSASVGEPPAPADSTLAAEARLLGDAWRELNAGATAAALALLQEHARRFPRSALAPEREAAKIVAWCRDERPWADAQARHFIDTRPTGSLTERVERACELDAKKP